MPESIVALRRPANRTRKQDGRYVTSTDEWQGRVGQSWADEWKRTDRSFGGLTDRLLGRVSARPIKRALDIGCGAGELSLAVARGHTQSEVIGLDISEQLVQMAKRRGEQLANVQFAQANAETWPGGNFAPDLIMSRHGVMFFDQPEAAFANLARIADPDARLVFSCFRDRSKNSWVERIASLLPAGFENESEAGAPGPFAFANQDHVKDILSRGGWTDIAFESVDYAYIAGTGENAVEDATSFFLRIGPAGAAAARLDDAERTSFIAKLRRYLENCRDGNLVALQASAWIVSARPGRA